MSDQFVAEIRLFPFNFAPASWAFCDGQIMAISQNAALFSLLGTNYGGNGTSTFGLPNLQGSFPMNFGSGAGLTPRDLGETGGESSVTLLQTELPSHTHGAQGIATSNLPSPSNAVFGGAGRGKQPAYAAYSAGTAVNMNPSAVTVAGGNQPHDNMPAFLVLNFCIALQGTFPARS